MSAGAITGVLVTSAGTASAVSVLKALRAQNDIPVTLIAVDADPLAAGLYLADKAALVPRSDHPDYWQRLRGIVCETGANVLLPIYSRELLIFSQNQEVLAAIGVRTLLSPPSTIELCNDKVAFSSAMRRLGIRVPRLLQPSEAKQTIQSGGTVFAKPKQGSASRGAAIVTSLTQLHEATSSVQMYILQECIEGSELTIDVLCDRDSNVLVYSPRYRLQTKGGQSVKARTASLPELRPTVVNICREIRMRGACNFQFFETSQGFVLIELNPRFAAGGLMLTVQAGANVPLLLLKLILGLPIMPAECQARPNLYMTRYWEECFFEKTIDE